MPSWTPEQYEQHLGRKVQRTVKTAHDLIAELAPEPTNTSAACGTQGAEPERAVRHDVDDSPQGEDRHSEVCFIRITSRRIRLIDPDNLVPKYFIDALRYAGAIHDDSASRIRLQVQQEKPQKGQPEETIIELWKL